MNMKYSIIKTEDPNYKFISLSLDRSTIDEYMYDLEEELKSHHYSGMVIFDLMLSHGASDRFYEAQFSGDRFTPLSFNKKNVIPNELLIYSSEFFSHNLDVIENGVLTPPQKFFFKKKILRYVHNKKL